MEFEHGMLEWEPGFTGVEIWIRRMEMWSMYWNENMNTFEWKHECIGNEI